MVVNVKDRRNYSRLRIDTVACIFIDSYGNEIIVKIHDISENGISFEVSKDFKDIFHVSDEIRFQFVETYLFGGKEETAVIMGKAQIRHIDELDDYCLVGCRTTSETYNNFAVRRQMAFEIEKRLKSCHETSNQHKTG